MLSYRDDKVFTEQGCQFYLGRVLVNDGACEGSARLRDLSPPIGQSSSTIIATSKDAGFSLFN